MDSSMSDTNCCITVLPNEWQNELSANGREVLQRHTSQNNRRHLPTGQTQTLPGKLEWLFGVFSQTPLGPFHKRP